LFEFELSITPRISDINSNTLCGALTLICENPGAEAPHVVSSFFKRNPVIMVPYLFVSNKSAKYFVNREKLFSSSSEIDLIERWFNPEDLYPSNEELRENLQELGFTFYEPDEEERPSKVLKTKGTSRALKEVFEKENTHHLLHSHSFISTDVMTERRERTRGVSGPEPKARKRLLDHLPPRGSVAEKDGVSPISPPKPLVKPRVSDGAISNKLTSVPPEIEPDPLEIEGDLRRIRYEPNSFNRTFNHAEQKLIFYLLKRNGVRETMASMIMERLGGLRFVKNIRAVILHVHSRYDACKYCAHSLYLFKRLAREQIKSAFGIDVPVYVTVSSRTSYEHMRDRFGFSSRPNRDLNVHVVRPDPPIPYVYHIPFS
jgi:hypothetical protein